MKIAALIARFLLGLMFTVFGLNGFLNFIPAQPPTNPLAVQFATAAMTSHYFTIVFVVQLAAGLLLLSGRLIPLALTLLGPILVNIINFHITMDPANIAPGLVATALWFILFFRYRNNFNGLFESQPRETIS